MELERAVTALARELGVSVQTPVQLRSTNNLVIWLFPSDVVAKIARGPTRLRDELACVRALAGASAPVVPPARDLGSVLHEVDGHDVTFWTYMPQDGLAAPSSQSVGSALAALHATMADLLALRELGLPEFLEPINQTIRSLQETSFAEELQSQDRHLLLDTLEHGRVLMSERSGHWQPIHGSPHRFNILVANGEPRFNDFETIAWGPIEWDLAHLEPEVSARYPAPFDTQLLASLRVVVSGLTSAQCWNAIDRGPDMRGHATHHLAIVQAHRQKRTS